MFNKPFDANPQGVDLVYLQTGIRIFLGGFEFQESVFFGYCSQLLYFFELNKSCILKCFIFSTVFFGGGGSFIHQVL